MPVDTEVEFRVPPRPRKPDLRYFTGEDEPTVNCKFLLENAQLFEFSWKFEGYGVRVDVSGYFHLDFEPHWHLRASPSEVFRPDEIADAVRSARDPLQNLERRANCRFASTVLSYQERGR
jgi:hypothetical protein